MARILLLWLLIPGLALGAEDLGRLFTTPAQRQSLNHLRAITPRVEAVAPAQSDEAALEVLQPVLPSSIAVQGYVKRSDGKKGTVWVNDTPIQENSATDDVAVGKLQKGNQVQLKVPGLDKSINLKAGQVYTPGTDSISEINTYGENVSGTNAQVQTIDELPQSSNIQ